MEKKHSRSNSLVYLLERTLRQTRMLLQNLFDEGKLKITVDQWIVLSQVGQSAKQNQRQIAAMVAKDPASITRILDLLEHQKLVKRIADKGDLRNSFVMITAAGKNMLKSCNEKVIRFKKVAGKGLSQDDLNHLKTILDNLFENSGGKLL
ncbi:MAG: MarR family winged helix-turn-helix transcriptional regulator [Bacteroidetes bacterium]|jgi:DNA-binding MarR family transcriptional regulator|nr:MarR family winged helix-turn-helix transcriptional regulator [Bacteroidota bacterium]